MNKQQIEDAIDRWAAHVFGPSVLPPEEIERAKAAVKKILELVDADKWQYIDFSEKGKQ